jgi:hypothetical protein
MQPQRLRRQATAIDHGGLYGHLRAQASRDALGLSPANAPAGRTSGRRVIS